jgi:hypothetical protein
LLIAKKCLYVCLSMFIAYTWLNHKPYDNFESHKMPFYGATWKKTLGACHMYTWKNNIRYSNFFMMQYDDQDGSSISKWLKRFFCKSHKSCNL